MDSHGSARQTDISAERALRDWLDAVQDLLEHLHARRHRKGGDRNSDASTEQLKSAVITRHAAYLAAAQALEARHAPPTCWGRARTETESQGVTSRVGLEGATCGSPH